MNNNKKLNIRIIIIFLIIIQSSTVTYAQNQLRQIKYTTKTTTIFSVPLETEMSLITNMDLAIMSPPDEMEIVEKTINSNYNITITREYPLEPLYSHHYQRMVSKSISNMNGITLYDRENTPIQSKDTLNIELYTIDAEAVESYGLFSEMNLNLDMLADKYIEEGYSVLNNDDMFSAIGNNIEIYINLESMVSEIRIFEDEILKKAIWKKYKTIGEYNIPIRTINFSYENLQNGIRCQKSEVTDYDSYSVVDSEGDYVINYVNTSNARKANNGNIKVYEYEEKEKKNSKLEVYPNPVIDRATIKSPYFLNNYINIKIVNTIGETVYYKEGLATGSDIEIDTSDFPAGVYVVMAGKGSQWKTTKLVKL